MELCRWLVIEEKMNGECDDIRRDDVVGSWQVGKKDKKPYAHCGTRRKLIYQLI